MAPHERTRHARGLRALGAAGLVVGVAACDGLLGIDDLRFKEPTGAGGAGAAGGQGGAAGPGSGGGGAGAGGEGGAPDGCGKGERPCGEGCVAESFADCDGEASSGCETDTATELSHCGGCGNACALPRASATCALGACAILACEPGFADCDGQAKSGCEANIAGDPARCGSCTFACAPGQSCSGGKCGLTCPAGVADCDGDAGTGCEATLGTTVHCAFCGDACDLPNATSACEGQSCVVVTCASGFADCDGETGNGCEVNLAANALHCGACGNACPKNATSTAICESGKCGFTCAAGFADCDGNALNGCEADLSKSTAHCGGCGKACGPVANGAPACVSGLCETSCTSPFADCNGLYADGCELNTSSNIFHCGACDRACSAANVASKSCNSGVCDSTCDLGFGNCARPETGADDGCETNVSSDDGDCGGCGNACQDQGGGLVCEPNSGSKNLCGCTASSQCKGTGVTSASCLTAQSLCSCGGLACNPGETCRLETDGSTACSCNGGTKCLAGWTCCDSPKGCFNLETSPANCGACGRACPSKFACVAGGCRCDANDDCNAGTSGSFSCNALNGRCTCNGTECQTGERCQRNGSCG